MTRAAAAMGKARSTVVTQIASATRKLEARNSTHAVAIAVRIGLIPAEEIRARKDSGVAR